MIRWGLFLIVIGIVALIAGWLANNPGDVILEWQGYVIDTSVAVLIAAVLLFAAIVALLYRLLWSVFRTPRLLARARRGRRRRRGFDALSRGMVAVAAGDAETARRQAARASKYLDDPPLTMLLSAQAAQMEGDEKAAERFFSAMRDRPATEFLGVRGLLLQAMKRQDWNEALALARRAYRLNPKSDWVVKILYEMQKRTGHWSDAAVTVDEAVRMKVLPPADAEREKADIYYQRSVQESGFEALKWARKAYKTRPGHAPAAIRWAELLVAEGRHKKAAGIVEDAWQQNPDPDLADIYWKARQANDATQKLQAAQRLADFNRGHPESRIVVAVAALEAHRWGEARARLEPLATADASPRVCRLMAQLEEAEHGDLSRAREWLIRATGAPAPSSSLAAPPAASAPAASAPEPISAPSA